MAGQTPGVTCRLDFFKNSPRNVDPGTLAKIMIWYQARDEYQYKPWLINQPGKIGLITKGLSNKSQKDATLLTVIIMFNRKL